MAQVHKKVFAGGVLTTACACLLFAGGYLALAKLILIPVPLDITRAAVKNVTENQVEITFKVTDGKKVPSISLEFTEDGKCFITLKRGVILQGNGNHTD